MKMNRTIVRILVVVFIASFSIFNALAYNEAGSSGNIEFKGHCPAGEYCVTFFPNYPSSVQKVDAPVVLGPIPSGLSIIQAQYGGLKSQVPSFTAPGFLFNGWNFEPSGPINNGNMFTVYMPVNECLTVYARWALPIVEPPASPDTGSSTDPDPTPTPSPSPDPTPSPSPPPSPPPEQTPAPTPPASPGAGSGTDSGTDNGTDNSPAPSPTPGPSTSVTVITGPPEVLVNTDDEDPLPELYPDPLPLPDPVIVTPVQPDLKEQDRVVAEIYPPQVESEVYVLPEDIPLIGIGNFGVMLFAPTGMPSWALLNLIMTILGLIYAAVVVIRAMIRRRKEEEKARELDDEEFIVSSRTLEEEEEERVDKYLRPGWLATALITAIIAVFLFLITQDMRTMMVLIDWWTLAHAIILVVEIIAVLFAFKKKRVEDEEEIDCNEKLADVQHK